MQFFVNITMSGINTIIPDHFEVLFWYVADQSFNEIHGRDGFNHIFFIFVPVVMESDGIIFPVIRINAGCSNDRTPQVPADVFQHFARIAFAWFGIHIEAASQYTWKAFAIWDEGNGTVDCSYEANIVLRPTEEVSKDKELTRLLKKNPFMGKDEIHKIFEENLREYLDYEFEEYCTEDDYYQPVVEDFEIEYRVTEWSKKNGFEVIACDGDGGDGGYEPKFRKGWY